MDTLYHYCSTATFHAIVTSKSIRLSSLSLSNDTLEGKLVADTITRLATADRLDTQSLAKLQRSISFFESISDCLGFCLSEEADLLSQWRGYAADATGISIGFSREYLMWLGSQPHSGFASHFTVKKVHYGNKEHEIQISPTYREVKKLIASGALRSCGINPMAQEVSTDEIEQTRVPGLNSDLSIDKKLLALLPVLFLLKSSAFREEKEWRLFTYLIRGGQDDCEYHPLPDRLVPHRTVTLSELDRRPIVEVVLAPKHLTPVKVVEDCLNQLGFGNVSVRRSAASYR